MPRPFTWRRFGVSAVALAALAIPAVHAKESKPASKDKPNPPVRFERLSSRAVFQNDGTGVVTTELRIRVLSEMGRQFAGQTYVLYSSRSEDGVVESVRTLKPDGRVLEADGAAMDVTPGPTAQAPLFSDLQAKVKLARSVDVGDAVESRTVRTISRPLKPGEFWFDYYELTGVPSDVQEIVLDVPADREVLVRWQADKPPQQETKDGRKTYRWTLPATDGDDDKERSPDPLLVASTMTAEQLGAWLVELQSDRSSVTPELKAKAEALTVGAKTAREKLGAIYSFVASSVRYVSISYGIGGYQPHAPAEVLHNLFGDCKDKDLLLRTLLAAVGIASQPVIVHVSLGMPQPEVGAPNQFNHVMTVATVEGEQLWMDSTTGLTPVGVIETQIRGKKALLPSATGSRVVEVPARSPVPDRGTVAMTGRLDAVGTLKLASTVDVSGQTEVWIRAMLRVQAPGADGSTGKVADVWGWMTSGYRTKVENFKASDGAALSVPLHVTYDSSAPWIDLGEMKAEPNLPSVLIRWKALPWSAKAIEKLRAAEPVRLGDHGEIIETVSLEIDPSYIVSAPASVKVERSFATYQSAYALKGHILTATRTLTVREPQVLPAKRSELSAFHDLIDSDLDQKVAMRRSTKPDLRKLAATLDADALVAAGSAACDDGDYKLASELLTMATEKDPKHKEAWIELARAQLGTLDLKGAEASLAKQIEIDPDDAAAQEMLGHVYWLEGEPAKSEAHIRKQLEKNPLNPTANASLGLLFAEQERWSEAVEPLTRAVQLDSDDFPANIILAKALAKTGRAAEARERATGMLTDAAPASERVQVAQVLAEQNLDLERAETEATKVMREAASRCRGVSLDGVPDDYWDSIGLLVAGYEVTGAVAFNKGNTERAISLFRTGYDLTSWPSTAMWLARAYARKGEPATGFRYYAYASREPVVNETILPPEELRGFLQKEFKGDTAAQAQRLAEVSKEVFMNDRVNPEGGAFVVPEVYPGDMGVDFRVTVLVDETGAVEDARADGGKEPFVGLALKDIRRVKFPVLGVQGSSIKSVRVVEFFYLPTKEVRAFWKFQAPSIDDVRKSLKSGRSLDDPAAR